jgi:acyl carrier protein
MKKLEEILTGIFQLDEKDLHDDLKMNDVPRWDSLTHMNLITSLEDNFQIEFTMDEIMEMVSVGRIRSIINQRFV